jgi:hypothetical protein
MFYNQLRERTFPMTVSTRNCISSTLSPPGQLPGVLNSIFGGQEGERKLPIFPDLPFIILFLDFGRQEAFIFTATTICHSCRQFLL